jgi:hypothetical protein
MKVRLIVGSFPGIIHFVFPVVPVSPSLPLPPPLERHPPSSLSCQHGNITVTLTIDNVKCVALNEFSYDPDILYAMEAK